MKLIAILLGGTMLLTSGACTRNQIAYSGTLDRPF